MILARLSRSLSACLAIARCPSEFEDVLEIRGVQVSGYRVLRAKSSAVPNAIAAFLLHLHETNGKEVHCYFG
jgi:hypothetical protein